MKRLTAYVWKYGTYFFVTAAGVLALITIIPFGFGIPTHSFDEKTGINVAGRTGGDLKCSDVFSHPNAIHFKIPNVDYSFQCGWSVWNMIVTFLFEILSVVEVGLFWGFVLVWRKKKLVTFIVYCCFILPLIMQFYLLYHHCSQIDNGRRACKSKKVDSHADCSISPFVFTPIFDCITFLMFVGGAICGTVLYFCRPKVNKAIEPEGGAYHKEKDGKKKPDEEDPIKDIKQTAASVAVSSFIDFSKIGGD